MKTEAGVVALRENGVAELAVHRDTACGDCASCGGCDAGAVRVAVENSIHASVGDTVLIESATGAVLWIAALVYLLPLLLFFSCYALGSVVGVSPLLLGGIGFAVSLLVSALVNRKVSGKVQYRMIGYAVPK